MDTPNTSPSYLLAFDGSEHSRAAVELLHDICGSTESPRKIAVHLLTVFTPRQIKDHHILSTNLAHTKQYLEDKGCFEVSADLILGYPSEKILEFAEYIKPNMILLGARGLRATLGILLGGVAQHVVEYSYWPVLVTRAPYKKLERVLLAIDSSPYSKQAVNHLKKLILPGDIKISVLHVLSPLPSETTPVYVSEIWPIIADQIPTPISVPGQAEEEIAWLEEEKNRGQELLDFATAELIASGRDATPVLLRGDAATEIIKFSKDNNVDLIISGSRGLSRLQGFFIGSVSRKLVHYANRSVLIVKTPAINTD